MTHQNLWIQFFTYSLCLARNFSPRLKSKCDYLLGSIALPVSILVASNFWPIFLYDRELILPIARELDGTFPPWLNYVAHLVILPVNFIQFYADPPKYVNDKASLAGLFTYSTVYISMLFAHRFYEGHYAYPFLDKYSHYQVAGTILFGLGFAYFSYEFGKGLCRLFRVDKPGARRRKPQVKMISKSD